MSSTNTKNALISIFDKQNLHILVPYLEKNNYHIYTTGGTMERIQNLIEDKSIASEIFYAARHIDPKSSFGDIIGFLGIVDCQMANMLKKLL